ncbi:hypothetical protein GGR53DRAFT_468889 [Hypoxylon sp. FL1150]|nr:hypothetical protein GGR53DRAFT_468889 [Hypoxylon sp. FL1150]
MDNLPLSMVGGFPTSPKSLVAALTTIAKTPVRRGWMALPLTEVLLITVLLVASISITRKQPLLRSSLVGLLTNRLEGWSDDELHAPEPQTREKLDGLADKMLAKLDADDVRRFKFVGK